MKNTEVVFVLVHGTWAPGAPWTKPGSWLRVRLRRVMLAAGAADVSFARVVWSGANSHAARMDASRRLRERVAVIAERRRCARIVVVGHSHGGNVALHAVGHCSATSERVAGVVTLATPFIGFRRQRDWVAKFAYALQNVGWSALLLGIPAALASVALPLILRYATWYLDMKLWAYRFARTWPCRLAWFWEGCGSALRETLAVAAALVGLATLGGVVAAAIGEALERLPAARDQADGVVRELQYFSPDTNVPVLVLTASADEALQVMTGARWIHTGAMAWVRATVALSVATGVLLSVGGFYLIQRAQERALGDPSTEPSWVVTLTLLQLIAVPTLFGAGALLGMLLRSMTERPIPTFDSDAGPINLFWSATASRRPDHAATIQTRNLGWAKLRRGGCALLHSRLYSSSAAVREIAHFALRVEPSSPRTEPADAP